MPTWGEIGSQLLADTGAAIASASPFGGLTEQEKNDWYRINEATRTPAADFGNKVTNIASTIGTLGAAPTVLPAWAGAAKNAVSGVGEVASLAPGAAATEMGAVGIPSGVVPTMWETAKNAASSVLPWAGGVMAMNRGGEAAPVATPVAKKAPISTGAAKNTTASPVADPLYSSYLGEYQKAYDAGDFTAAYRATDNYYKSKGIPLTMDIANGIVKAFKAKEDASNPATPAPGAPPSGPSPQETKELEFMKHAMQQVKQITGVDPNADLMKMAMKDVYAGPLQLENGTWISGDAAYQKRYEMNLARIKPAYDYAQKMVADMVGRFRAMNPAETGHIIKGDERYVRPGTPGTGMIEGNLVLKPGEQVVPAAGGAPIVNPNKPATTPLGSAQLESAMLSLLPRMDSAVRSVVAKDPAKLKALEDDLMMSRQITDKNAAMLAVVSAYKKAAPAIAPKIDEALGSVYNTMLGSQRQAAPTTAVPSSVPGGKIFWNGMNGQTGTGTRNKKDTFFRSDTGKTFNMTTGKEVDPATI